MAKIKLKARRGGRRHRLAIAADFAREGASYPGAKETIRACVYLGSSRAGAKVVRCGWAKNPRAALAKALRSAAQNVRQIKRGAFAGIRG